MVLTIAVVMGGVRNGVERWSRILMPILFVMIAVMLANSFTVAGFGEGFRFIFGFHTEDLTAAGVLEALGHAFFTLSLGMGTILTYGSYLNRDDDIVAASISVATLDTVISLSAAMIIFPVIFTFGMEPGSGPGLVFITVPVALSQLPGGAILAVIFFALLVFAAVTSAISILEVTTSYFIDEHDWSRAKATLVSGTAIALVGIPSALCGSTEFFAGGFIGGRNWFDSFDYLVSNWLLPLGGLGIALFTAWRLDDAIRHREFLTGSKLAPFYKGWLFLLKLVVPVAISLVFLHAVGLV
jgi:NSS family neurotransmitter:Na+ symporter